jgi:hypothetical protein
MVQQQNCGAKSWAKLVMIPVASLLILSGCSSRPPEPEIKTVTQVQRITVPTVARPKPIDLVDVRVWVVNKDNLDDFVAKFTDEHGEFAIVALSIDGYENLALNIADLRRYINQQTDIIVYYEDSMKTDAPSNDDKNTKTD